MCAVACVVFELCLAAACVWCVTICVTFLPLRGSRMQLIMRETKGEREGLLVAAFPSPCIASFISRKQDIDWRQAGLGTARLMTHMACHIISEQGNNCPNQSPNALGRRKTMSWWLWVYCLSKESNITLICSAAGGNFSRENHKLSTQYHLIYLQL